MWLSPPNVRRTARETTRRMFHEIPGGASNKPVKKEEMLSQARELKI
jgi:hypothetical protein